MTHRILLVSMLLVSLAVFPVAAQDAACNPGFRLFDHELLATDPVCVPEDPQRVVSLDPFSYELLLLNDTPPVGAVGYLEAVYSGNFPYLREEVAAIESVGSPPNVEAILALEPDLIIGSYLAEELQPQLAAIAPTVSYVPTGSGDWKRPMQMVGDLLGLSGLVDDLFVQYEARLADFRTAVENPSDVQVSIIRIQPDQLMLNLVNSFPAVIVTDAGLGRPASQAYSEAEAIEVYGGAVGAFISIEEMQLADGDFIFAWSNQGSDEENAEADANWETIQASPLWNTLTAAQNGTAHRVRGHWLGWGIFAAHSILDDLFTYIADVDPAEVSPNPFLTAEAKSTSGECETGYRLLDNPYMVNDPVCVPENPQRVVVLHPVTDLDNLIALGIVPAGTAIYTDRYAYAPYLLDLGMVEDGAITPLGSLTEPNYEVMLTLQPDLIIARDFHDVAALSQIAPTVAYPYAQWRWRDFLLALADAVNRTAEAEVLLSDYDARVEAVRAALGEEAGELVVSVVRVRPDGLRLYNTPRALSGLVLESVGLARPDATADGAGDSPFVEISLEELDQADGHIIFVWGEIAGTEEILLDLQASPLWQTLEAVQNERVYVVAEPVWFAPGIIGMHLLLDDILTYVAGVDPAEVAPNPYMIAVMGD